jgi:HK97 gp10 family phage protein
MSEVKGLKELIATLERIPKELDKDVEQILEANAREIELQAKKFAPVGTPESTGIKGYIGGSLRNNIKAYRENKKTWAIKANYSNTAPYSIFVEFGTRFMNARPFLFPAFFKQRSQFIDDLEALLKAKFK